MKIKLDNYIIDIGEIAALSLPYFNDNEWYVFEIYLQGNHSPLIIGSTAGEKVVSAMHDLLISHWSPGGIETFKSEGDANKD